MNPERGHENLKNTETSAELNELAQERLKSLEKAPIDAENSKESQVEMAREVIEKHTEQPPKDTSEHSKPPVAPHRNPFINYMHTMTSLRRHLTPSQRRISTIIHNPTVERASEIMEKTVMRPSVTLGATTTALLVGSILYFMARHYGFTLSGSELIIAMLVGGIFGGFTELVLKPFSRRKR